MTKSFFRELNTLFYHYARRPITEYLTYIAQVSEANFTREDAEGHMRLRFISNTLMDELGIVPDHKDGIQTKVVGCMGPSYETHTPEKKVMNWIRKVDGEAVKGKKFASYELSCGPFYLFFRSDQLPHINANGLVRTSQKTIEAIIRQNKKKML
jgi:hypothetical protein